LLFLLLLLLLLLLRLLLLVLGRNGEKARAKHRAGGEEAIVADADRSEVAADGHVFFHDALWGRERKWRGSGGRKKRKRSRRRRTTEETEVGGRGMKKYKTYPSAHLHVLRSLDQGLATDVVGGGPNVLGGRGGGRRGGGGGGG